MAEFCSPGQCPRAGNYPRIPGITLGLGLVRYPLSFATHRFALLVQSGGSAPQSRGRPHGRATNDMSQFRWFHKRPRRILLRRPAGFSITVDDPVRRSHHPRARWLPRVNSATGLQLTIPIQFAFADPLVLPASGATHGSSQNRSYRGLPTLRQATRQTLR
jgi:hypothetical protein